jgi:predicted component of type VI protein secretion system
MNLHKDPRAGIGIMASIHERNRTAWSAVKNVAKKQGDHWELKDKSDNKK